MLISKNLIQTFGLILVLLSLPTKSAIINWTDWESGINDQNGFTGFGSITTVTSNIDVTYNNPAGVAFMQTGTGTDYFANGPFTQNRDPTDSPFTSALVENIPTAAEMIGLRFAGTQTLSFSETIANPIFSYVSLNGNGYSFDQDFEILSFGDPSDGNDCGYWGCGTSYKQIVDLGGGNFEYQLLGTGEPHGSIRFTGAFDTVTWRSLSSENWNGFTVGVEGTAEEVFTASEPSAFTSFLLLVTSLISLRRVSRR